VVEAAGPGVDLKEGDHVATTQSHRQYYVARKEHAVKVPEGVEDRDAGWHTLSRIVQNGVRHTAHELGEAIVVVGLGPLGQLTVQFANLMGPRALIAIDPVASRLEMAASHGATHALAVGVDEALDEVKNITEERMADTVYDMTGNDKVFAGAQQLLRVRGTLSLIGDTGSPGGQHLTSAVISKSLNIVASHGSKAPLDDSVWSPWTHRNMTKLFFHYLKMGRMRVEDINTHVFSPLEPQEAYQKLLHDRADTMGCHFDWSKV